MDLSKTVSDLEEVPEKFRGLYSKTADGEYELDPDFSELLSGSAESKKRLDEFRNNNRKLYNELQELKKKVSGQADDDEIERGREALRKLKEFEEKELVDKGDLEELFKRRTQTILDDHAKAMRAKDEAIAKLDSASKSYKSKLDLIEVDRLVSEAVGSVGNPRKGALKDILSRGRGTWRFDEEGQLKPYNGDEVIFGKTGDVMKPEEWASALLEEAPHLFEPSGGGNGGGNEKKPTTAKDGKYYVDMSDPVAVGRHAADIKSGKAIPRFSS